MNLQNQLGSQGEFRKAVKELQSLKQIIVTGADVNSNIAIHDIKTIDTIASVVNLTDLTNLDITGVKASQDTWGSGDFDTVIEAVATGTAGNGIRIGLIGDSDTGVGVSIELTHAPFTFVNIHYETGVSTIGDVEAMIDTFTGDSGYIAIKTAGTAVTVLATATDDFTATALEGGVDEIINEIPVITSQGNIQFSLVDTTAKKLLVTYYVTEDND